MPGFRRCSISISSTLLLCQIAVAADAQSPINGWYLAGNTRDNFTMSLATDVAYDGSGSAHLASVNDVAGAEFGTLMQCIDARTYHGKRRKFSAHLLIEKVTTGAALWMRIDGYDGEILRFDNMNNRGLFRGSRSWFSSAVILDVPASSKRICYGVLLKGTGKLWIDSVSVEAVFSHEAVTDSPVTLPPLPIAPDELPAAPKNLDFEPEY